MRPALLGWAKSKASRGRMAVASSSFGSVTEVGVRVNNLCESGGERSRRS